MRYLFLAVLLASCAIEDDRLRDPWFPAPCIADEDCDDGSWCNGVDVCRSGACFSTGHGCDDDDPCTADSCSEVQRRCLHSPVDRDSDGWRDAANGCDVLARGTDCDDSDPLVHPQAPDPPGDLIDGDCDGLD